LRHEKELVSGKSLKKSLELWNTINTAIQKIVKGETKNEDGDQFTDAVFNGIGGSYLGPLMLVVAMKGPDFNFSKDLPIRLHFVSNTDPDYFALLMSKLDLKKTIMVNMSKSGSTAETKGNMEAFNNLLKEKGINLGLHNIAITTKGSAFDKFAAQNNFMHVFHMFEETGGRFSVASAIGMVPCAFAGLDFAEFLKGQQHMDQLCRNEDAKKNPAMLCAIGMDWYTKTQGRKNMIVLGYSDFLKEFAHYLQQLYMESLGKEYNEEGFPNPEGQTVFGGVGTGEQHAFMQQVQKGIPDNFVRFVYFLKRKHDFKNEVAGSMGRQLLAFVKGTENALLHNEKPFISSTFEQCDLFNMGMMVAMEENIVGIIAAFRHINAYDQPGVQDGKLAANQMNAVSKEVEAFISSKKDWEWEGNAVQFLQAMKDENKANKSANAPIMFVDAVLSDIYANIGVKDSYNIKNIKIKRRFENNKFVYKFSSKL
jgi:glucose-6-phosphate isomerase